MFLIVKKVKLLFLLFNFARLYIKILNALKKKYTYMLFF